MSRPLLSVLFPCCTPRKRSSTATDEESTPLLDNHQAKGKGKDQEEIDGTSSATQSDLENSHQRKALYDEKVLKRIVYDVQSSFIPLDKAQHSSNGTATSTTGSISLLNSTTSTSHLTSISNNQTPGPSRIPLPELESKDDVEAVSKIYLASLGGIGDENQEIMTSPIQQEDDSNIAIISGQTVVLPLKSHRNSGSKRRRRSNHSTGSSGSNLSQSSTSTTFRKLPRPLTLVRNVQLNLNSRSNSLESQDADQLDPGKSKEAGIGIEIDGLSRRDKEISTASGSLGLTNIVSDESKDLGTKLREREEAEENHKSASSSRSNSQSQSNSNASHKPSNGSKPLRVVNIWAGDDDFDEDEHKEELEEEIGGDVESRGENGDSRTEDEDNEFSSLTPTATRSSTSSSATTPTKTSSNLPFSSSTHSNPNSSSNSVSSLSKPQNLSLSITPTMNSGRVQNQQSTRTPKNRSMGSGNSMATEGSVNSRDGETEAERMKEEMNLKNKRRISNSQVEDEFERKLIEIERKNGKAHTRDQWGES